MAFDPLRLQKPQLDPLKHRAELLSRVESIDLVNQAITTIRDEFISHPDLAAYFSRSIRALLADVDDEDDGERAAGIDAEDGSTALSRIIRYFEERGNRPATMSEVVEGVEGNPVTIKQTLYKRHKDKFAFEDGPAGKRLWKLSEVMWNTKFLGGRTYTPPADQGDEDIPF